MIYLKQVLFIFICLTFISCSNDSSSFRYFFTGLGTTIQLELICSDQDIAYNAYNSSKQIIHDSNKLYNPYQKESLISQINDVGFEEYIKIPREFFQLIELAKEYSDYSHGRFDISFAPLKEYWNFTEPDFHPPKKEQIARILPFVNYQNILLEKKGENYFVKLASSEMKLELGSIAKGRIIDKIRKDFLTKNIHNFYINIGGDIFIEGSKNNKNWIVGIQHPRIPDKLFAKLECNTSKAITTSGDYEKYAMDNGRRYHHILDANTGYPSMKNISVTVLADSAMEADVAATTLFLLDAEESIALANKLPEIDTLIIDANQKIHLSDDLTTHCKYNVITELQPH
jgi:FAD:protein FMN transferase